MTRSVAMAGVLGAAVGVPYALDQAPDGWTASVGLPAAATAPADAAAAGAFTPIGRLDGVVNRPIGDLLNWGITKEWVYANWDRKTTGLADPGLYGVRVPVVTGARPTDVAGSLSYYFDAQGALQRIRLHGRTADTTELVRLAAAAGMQRRAPMSPGDQLFQTVERRGLVRSELRTRPEPVLRAATPRSSFVVDLELNRPGSEHRVVPRAPRLDLPEAPAPTGPTPEEVLTGEQRPPEGTPVFPWRGAVPDAPTTASAPPPAVEPAAAEAPPQPPAAAADLRPVYRDELRWPY